MASYVRDPNYRNRLEKPPARRMRDVETEREPAGTVNERTRLPATGRDRLARRRRHRIGGAYWMPPRLHRWLMPRGMPSFEREPMLRSKISP